MVANKDPEFSNTAAGVETPPPLAASLGFCCWGVTAVIGRTSDKWDDGRKIS
ncbi:hypothetical protein Hdeb2414_s0017g00510191 [Helianthus debilis subsp. tardiflorus]